VATVKDVLDRLTAKPKRAHQHIADLEDACSVFFKAQFSMGDKNPIVFKDDPKTGDRIYYIVRVPVIPLELASMIGDILSNLRSSLDHMAHHLVSIGTGQPGPFPHVYFPIFKSSTEYQPGKLRKIKGMRQDAIDAIDAIEPYKGGKGAILWRLHQLNNVDKDRVLHRLAIAYMFHSLLPSQRTETIRGYLASHPGGMPPDLRHTVREPEVGRFILKGNDTLLTLKKAEMEEYMHFHFDIVFDDAQIAKGETVVETLKEMADFVLNVILSFNRLGLL
jgi:hypothetical protein